MASAQPDLGEATNAVVVHPARAMGSGASAAPALATAFDIGTIADQTQVMRICSPHVNTRTRQKTRSWTNQTLQQAMDKITDEGMKLKMAAKVFGIPNSSLRDHMYGRTTSR